MFHVTLDCNGRPLELDRPRIAGIVNVTPDSFCGRRPLHRARARDRARLRLVERGRRPARYRRRIDAARRRRGRRCDRDRAHRSRHRRRSRTQTNVPISIDTSQPEVMRAAVAAGAGLINDVRALRGEGALDAAAALGVPVVLDAHAGRAAHDAGRSALRRRRRRSAPIPDRPPVRVPDGRHRQEENPRRSRFWFWQDARAQSRAAAQSFAIRRDRAGRRGTFAQIDDRHA